MGEKLFCREDQTEQLDQYYYSGTFKYCIETENMEEHYFTNKSIQFSDELFFGIYDLDARIVEKCGDDYWDYFEEQDTNVVDRFVIYQTSQDEMFTRFFEVFFTDNGKVYITHKSNIAGDDFRSDDIAVVTSDSVKKALNSAFKLVRSEGTN